jgi:hypothetical protein
MRSLLSNRRRGYCREQRRHLLLVAAVSVTIIAGSSSVPASEIWVAGSPCSAKVNLQARDARLSEILYRLAKQLDFQLLFQSDSDPLINIRTVRSAEEVVMNLASAGNVSTTHLREAHCGVRPRMSRVFVLRGTPSSAEPLGPSPPRFAQMQQTPSQVKPEREAIDLYYQAHGVEPTAAP